MNRDRIFAEIKVVLLFFLAISLLSPINLHLKKQINSKQKDLKQFKLNMNLEHMENYQLDSAKAPEGFQIKYEEMVAQICWVLQESL